MDALDEAIDYILDKKGKIPRAQIDAALLRAGRSPETIEDLWMGVGEARMVEVFEVGHQGTGCCPGWTSSISMRRPRLRNSCGGVRRSVTIPAPNTRDPMGSVDPDGVLYVIGRRIFRSAARAGS